VSLEGRIHVCGNFVQTPIILLEGKMPEPDHKFRRRFIGRSAVSEEEVSEKKKQKAEGLRQRFKWKEDLEEKEGEKPPVQFSMSDVTQCCEQVVAEVLKGISVESFHDIAMGKMYFEVPLTCDFHLLLYERFNGDWSLDSRLEMMDKIRAELSSKFDGELYRNELNQRIQTVIPNARRTCLLDDIYLNDDTVMLEDNESPFSVEISLRFEENIDF